MQARGFPEKWISWVRVLLTSFCSRIVLNGNMSEYFGYKQGLCQGDPLSPLLFIVSVHVLQRMIEQTNGCLVTQLSSRLMEPILALQYADDPAIIAKADLTTMIPLKLLLWLFSKVSALRINYEKRYCFSLEFEQH